MSTRKSSQASGWPSAVGSIQPSPKDRFEADRFDLLAAECSACGLPQTQMPNPDAVTSTLYSLHAGVFSSGVVKLDGGDGGGGALSLPGVRGDAPSCSLELVQPMAVPSLRGCLLFWGCLAAAALLCSCPWWGEAGRVSPALVMRLSSLSKAGLSRSCGGHAGRVARSVFVMFGAVAGREESRRLSLLVSYMAASSPKFEELAFTAPPGPAAG